MSEALQKFFYTDWSAMTRADWLGTVTVTVLAVLMAGLYVWVFRPANKDRIERYRDFVNRNDEMNGNDEMTGEVGHGHAK